MKPRVIAWAVGAALLVVIVVMFEPLVIVSPSYRGVLLRFGAADPQSLAPGLHVITRFLVWSGRHAAVVATVIAALFTALAVSVRSLQRRS